ncbi:glycosyltransferase family 4 protein [Methylibium sp.]|uniref:glycosyltransferase family 4 protein n=1 Tax=Methylibium sp. TaxID=2067992 RepID=UPI003D11B169
MSDVLDRASLPQVFINGRFLSQRVTGVQRYAHETLRCLDDLLGQTEQRFARWTLLVPPGVDVPPQRNIEVRTVGRLRGHLWEQIELPWFARKGLLFSFGFTGPLVKARQIITVHDAAVVRMPQVYGWRFRAWYRLVVGWVAARAPRVLTVSKFSADEAAACFGIAPEQLRVTTEGWQHLDSVVPDDSLLDRHGLRGKPFALAVSSPTPNKNFAAISKALDLLGADAPRCVVVGAADAAIFQSAGSGDALLRVGYVTDGQLKALYQHATCFVFPSFYEGFGIPALEAMACGCPVIASTAPALREVCGEAALSFDPSSAPALADRLRQLFDQPPLQARLRAAGLERAKAYSWRQGAQLNLSAVREVLDT